MRRPTSLDVQGLTKDFGTSRTIDLLTFTAAPGHVTGLLGADGAGKTTTLRMLLGLVQPTSGTATVGGIAFGDIVEPARVVGAALHPLGVHPGRSPLGHLRVFAAAMRLPDARVHATLRFVGLEPVARRAAGTLSVSMQQRLALATALLGDPSVLVLDEPTNGLDPQSLEWLGTFLRAFARSGGTVLVSSPLLRSVPFVDRLVLLGRGTAVYQGSIDDLHSRHRARVLVASSNPATLATALAVQGITDAQVQPDGRLAVAGAGEHEITALAAHAGVTVYGMIAEHVDLEQVLHTMSAGGPR